MEIFSILGIIMFVIAPFSLFCSDNGNGIALCVMFLVLGIICRWLGNGGLNPTLVITRKNAWETRYKQHLGMYMASKIKSGEEQKLNAEDDRLARHWSSVSVGRDMTPSDEEQERIARSMGIETYQMKVEAKYRWNRIQKEKIRLMLEFEQKYKQNDIRQDIEKTIKALNDGMYILNSSTVMRDMRLPNLGIAKQWERRLDSPLIKEEAEEAKKWVCEYKERLAKMKH